jgi:hypothetical protein
MADQKMHLAPGMRTTFNHAFTSPLKPGFIGVFYW